MVVATFNQAPSIAEALQSVPAECSDTTKQGQRDLRYLVDRTQRLVPAFDVADDAVKVGGPDERLGVVVDLGEEAVDWRVRADRRNARRRRLVEYSSAGKLDAYQAVWRRHGETMQYTYYSNGGLADLQQRKAAIDYFLASSNRVLPDARELHDRLLKALAKDAVGASSAAVGQDNREISEEISQFACNLWPEVRRTRSWHLLAIKRLIGNKLWRILAPAAARIRKMAANAPREDDRRSST